MRRITTALVAIATLAAVTANASEKMARDQIEELAMARNRLAYAASDTKGYNRANLEFKKARLDALIDDLNNGKYVDPAQINLALDAGKRTN